MKAYESNLIIVLLLNGSIPQGVCYAHRASPYITNVRPCIEYVLSCLQHSEACEQASKDNGKSVRAANVKSNPGGLLAREIARGVGAPRSAGEDGVRVVGGIGGAGGLGFRGIVSRRVLGPARMVLTALGRAFVVLTTGLDALVAPFLANIVWECQRVLGNVGLLVVAAETSVGKVLL